MYSDRRIFGRVIAGLLLAALLGGCQHVNHLRDAQDTFNETAALENKAKFGADVAPASIQSGYSAVALSLDALENDADTVNRLRKDQLYGNVLVLKSITYWRLRKYSQAKTAAQAALKEGVEPGTRDYALLTALPGLIRSDEALAKALNPKSTSSDMAEIVELIGSAESIIDQADKTLPKKHPMHSYLSLSGLIALNNLAQACEKLAGSDVKRNACYVEQDIACRAKKWGDRAKAAEVDAKTIVDTGWAALDGDPQACAAARPVR